MLEPTVVLGASGSSTSEVVLLVGELEIHSRDPILASVLSFGSGLTCVVMNLLRNVTSLDVRMYLTLG